MSNIIENGLVCRSIIFKVLKKDFSARAWPVIREKNLVFCYFVSLIIRILYYNTKIIHHEQDQFNTFKNISIQFINYNIRNKDFKQITYLLINYLYN